jgi:hypothetical protein
MIALTRFGHRRVWTDACTTYVVLIHEGHKHSRLVLMIVIIFQLRIHNSTTNTPAKSAHKYGDFEKCPKKFHHLHISTCWQQAKKKNAVDQKCQGSEGNPTSPLSTSSPSSSCPAPVQSNPFQSKKCARRTEKRADARYRLITLSVDFLCCVITRYTANIRKQKETSAKNSPRQCTIPMHDGCKQRQINAAR